MSESLAIHYINLPETVICQPVGWTEKGIIAVVQGFTEAGKECWVTDAQFGSAMTIHPTTINRTIKKLVADRYLTRTLIRSDVGTPRRLCLGDSYYQNANRLLAKRQEPISKMLRTSYQIASQKITNKKESKEIETASDTATADPHLPFSQTIVELEQPTEQEKLKLERSGLSKKPKKETESLDELDLTPEIRAAADRWITHKQLIGKPIGLKKLKSEIKKYGAGLPTVVEKSISQGWDGLHRLKAQTAIAPWLRAAQVTSDLISAFQAVNFQNPKTSENYQKILSLHPALKDIVTKTREKERIETPTAFIARIQGDEFFRVRIEKSIKEQLTVVLTSGQKENQ